MPTPSLLIVPARFKSGKLYSQIPTSGAGDFTVTRATSATRVNASGLIESVASGIPRLDYFASGGTVGCPALLVEPSGSNLALRSEDFNNVYWTKTGGTITSSTTNAPNGQTTVDQFTINAAATEHIVFNGALSQATGTYSTSVFVKQGSGSQYIQIATNGASGTNWASVIFDITNQTFSDPRSNGSYTLNSYNVTNYSNGWYRINIVTTNSSDTYRGLRLRFSNSATPSYASFGSIIFTGNGTDNFYVWGAQSETGSVATSYIPTTTAAVTRNADVVSVSGAVSGSIGQTQGTIYAEVDLKVFPVAGSPIIGIISLNVGAANLQNCIVLGIERLIAGTNRFYSFVQRANATQAGIFGPSISAGVFKVAFAYKENDFTMYVNGVQTGTPDTSGLLPSGTLNEVLIGTRFTGDTQFLNDRIRAAALYTTRLTNAELAALTTL